MIEIIVFNYLRSNLSVPVYVEKPTQKPQRYVVIDKIGSSKENHLLSSTIAFQSYAESKYQAALLNEQVKEAIENMIVLDEIAGVSLKMIIILLIRLQKNTVIKRYSTLIIIRRLI